MSDWRPLETADKDQPEILIGRYLNGAWVVVNARWVKWQDWDPPPDDPEDQVDGWFAFLGNLPICGEAYWMPAVPGRVTAPTSTRTGPLPLPSK